MIGLRWRGAAFANLYDVIAHQFLIGEHFGVMDYRDGIIEVVISVDATPIWRALCTRADEYVDLFGNLTEMQEILKIMFINFCHCRKPPQLGNLVGYGWD